MFIEMTKIHDDSYYNPSRTTIMVNTDTIEYIDKYDGKTHVHFVGGEKVRIEPIDIDELNKNLIFVKEKI